jgi:hypothetical protein
MAKDAGDPLDLIRPAVAIALLWANLAWAQVDQQPVQPVENIRLDLADRPDHYATAVTVRNLEPIEQPEALSLRLATGVGYDANVFRTEQGTSSDFFWNLRPAIFLNKWAGKHSFRLGYEGDYRKYVEFDSEDFFDHRIFANANLDLTRKVDVNVRGQMWWGHDPRGAMGARVVNPGDLDTWREYRVKTELAYGREITRAQIVAWAEFSGIRYLNNDQSDRDFDRQDYRARGRWRFNPRFYGLLEGGIAQVNHLDPTNQLDRNETGILVGFGWLATAKTSGEVLVGVLNRDFDDPSRANASDLDWDMRIHWSPKPYSKVTAFTHRTSREDAAGGVGTFLADTFGVRWRHAFSERLELDTNLEYTRAVYDSPREDDYWRCDLGVTQGLTRWLDFRASYQFLGRRSNIPGLDYNDHMVLLELRAGTDYGF